MKKLGRAFNHLEDLVLFYGSLGAQEAVQHLIEISKDSSTVRMKWDGQTQIYWGREEKNGPLILSTHNSWSRNIKTTNPGELYDFIVNKSGSTKTQIELNHRKIFAKNFSNLFEIFDNATPPDFIGFVYADILFFKKPEIQSGNYIFTPNNTTYIVDSYSNLGKKVSASDIMITGHGYFSTFGQSDDFQIPKQSFNEFSNDKLIVNNPFYASSPVVINNNELITLNNIILDNAYSIDELLSPIDGVSNYKDVLYRYVNSKVKSRELDSVGTDLQEWISNSRISKNQIDKIIKRLDKYKDSVTIMFNIIKYIMELKNSVIEQLNINTGEFKTINSEGWVKYSDGNKKFGNIKLVPRQEWTPVQNVKNIDVGVCYGRFNPPHVGHVLSWETASKYDTYYVGTNPNTHNKKNPLPFDVKKEIMCSLMPQLKTNIVPTDNVFTLASHIFNELGENVVLHICTDEEWITPALQRNNGVPGKHGYYKFHSIMTTQVQRISSASVLREAVIIEDKTLFTMASGLPADYEFKVNNNKLKFFDIVKECLERC